jgi:spore coat protein A
MTSRREFLARGATAGAGLYLVSRGAVLSAGSGSLQSMLSSSQIPRFVTPLVVPPAMPATSTSGEMDVYRIAVRQLRQAILPPPLPQTTVWGFGSVDHPGSSFAPSFTIETTAHRAARIEWRNELVDRKGRYLPHLLPVDQTLHWANPSGELGGRDMHGTSQDAYTGPVPWVTHVHGAHARRRVMATRKRGSSRTPRTSRTAMRRWARGTTPSGPCSRHATEPAGCRAPRRRITTTISARERSDITIIRWA